MKLQRKGGSMNAREAAIELAERKQKIFTLCPVRQRRVKGCVELDLLEGYQQGL